jgi:glutaredoxin
MEFELPAKKMFTVYSKSGCPNCLLVKTFLKEKKIVFNVVDCDEYLIEKKEAFLEFIKNLTEKDCKIFPMVFCDGKFVGGYNETKDRVEKMMLLFEDIFSF